MDPEIGMAPARIEWRQSDQPVGYDEAVTAMERRIAAIRDGDAPELGWLLEHPPLYTAGTSARAEDPLEPAPPPGTAFPPRCPKPTGRSVPPSTPCSKSVRGARRPLSRPAGEGAERSEAGEGNATEKPSPTGRFRGRSSLSRGAGEG